MKRADFHLLGTAGEEGELVSLGVNARPGPTATSPLPERAAQAGFSLNKSGARMVEDGWCEG
jgi:D-alanine-D-alanine ligase-like ATP-grasp enzyme